MAVDNKNTFFRDITLHGVSEEFAVSVYKFKE
jgi:hypothetical protein